MVLVGLARAALLTMVACASGLQRPLTSSRRSAIQHSCFAAAAALSAPALPARACALSQTALNRHDLWLVAQAPSTRHVSHSLKLTCLWRCDHINRGGSRRRSLRVYFGCRVLSHPEFFRHAGHHVGQRQVLGVGGVGDWWCFDPQLHCCFRKHTRLVS